MNALWLMRICAYKNSPQSVESAKRLIAVKIERQKALLNKYKKPFRVTSVENAKTLREVLLEEARAAKLFWREFKELLPHGYDFSGRTPKATDIINRLLDLGYHHLLHKVKKILEQYHMPPALGLLHGARKTSSTPLAYDLMEIFRADLIDAEVLRFIRLKKRKIETITQKDIGHFLHEVNKRCRHVYYLKDFKRCHAYEYYMEVQILKFAKAVNHGEVFKPLSLPVRHDMRCPRSPLDSAPPSMLSFEYNEIKG